MGPNKGPQGHEDYGNIHSMPEPQEYCEAEGERIDYKGGDPAQDPFTLKAPEDNHTPNGKEVLKDGKIGWSFQHGRG